MDNQESGVIDIDLTNDITSEFVVRVRVHDDEAAIVLKGHLLIEHLLDRIIEVACRAPDKILEDSHNYTFAVKLQLVYAMDLLPDHIHENIVRVNKLRNKLAHSLDFQLDPASMIFVTPDGAKTLRPKKARYPIREYLRILCFATLSQLKRYMESELDIDPRYMSRSRP